MDGSRRSRCLRHEFRFPGSLRGKVPPYQPVFDYFPIVKNFNDKVVSEVRKDEQRRLYEEGNIEAARALKKTKYILTSSRETLQKKDSDAAQERVIRKGSSLFKMEDFVRKSGYEERYNKLLEENRLFFTLDLIKEKLALAYSRTEEMPHVGGHHQHHGHVPCDR